MTYRQRKCRQAIGVGEAAGFGIDQLRPMCCWLHSPGKAYATQIFMLIHAELIGAGLGQWTGGYSKTRISSGVCIKNRENWLEVICWAGGDVGYYVIGSLCFGQYGTGRLFDRCRAGHNLGRGEGAFQIVAACAPVGPQGIASNRFLEGGELRQVRASLLSTLKAGCGHRTASALAPPTMAATCLPRVTQ
jgi:hypothetical protein